MTTAGWNLLINIRLGRGGILTFKGRWYLFRRALESSVISCQNHCLATCQDWCGKNSTKGSYCSIEASNWSPASESSDWFEHWDGGAPISPIEKHNGNCWRWNREYNVIEKIFLKGHDWTISILIFLSSLSANSPVKPLLCCLSLLHLETLSYGLQHLTGTWMMSPDLSPLVRRAEQRAKHAE